MCCILFAALTCPVSMVLNMRNRFLLLLILYSSAAAAAPNATECVVLSGNLDASASLTTVPPGTPTFTQLSSSASFEESFVIVDSLGAGHTVFTYYFHTGAGTWAVRSYVDAGDVIPGNSGNALLIGSVSLNFNSSGTRTPPPVQGMPDYTLSPFGNWANSASGSPVNVSFPEFTQFVAASNISSLSTTCPDVPTATPTPTATVSPTATPIPLSTTGLDFDRDGLADLVLYRSSTRTFVIQNSSGTTMLKRFGPSDAVPFAGDFSGDGAPDLGLWNKSSGAWSICTSESNYNCSTTTSFVLGARGDRPFAADFDGDGKLDPAIYRPRNRSFLYFSEGKTTRRKFGKINDIPVGMAR